MFELAIVIEQLATGDSAQGVQVARKQSRKMSESCTARSSVLQVHELRRRHGSGVLVEDTA